MAGAKRFSIRGGDPRYMPGGDHSVETGCGEMDEVYRELDRLFDEFWHSTERRNVLSDHRTREKMLARHSRKKGVREDGR